MHPNPEPPFDQSLVEITAAARAIARTTTVCLDDHLLLVYSLSNLTHNGQESLSDTLADSCSVIEKSLLPPVKSHAPPQ
ncbi:MAG: hypothetical protein KME35_03805 [Aphanocapsa sp. GSE-SYN-MK-11-07L]|nr:hypothetical protein [Aphanocapsa sp. GSE-SYN-MK-11-07L]